DEEEGVEVVEENEHEAEGVAAELKTLQLSMQSKEGYFK
ncbi:hypothetical protein A2U01_0113101, partial [Trifolium medium]|nr:hypothetical protein [Trifolium medium]